jgi:hypothetical protein
MNERSDKTLEQTVGEEKTGYKEFIAPDFTNNGYCNAKYRASDASIQLGDLKVPVRVEVLNSKEEWQQHPVVFIHYGNYEGRKAGRGMLIIFLPNGNYSSRPYDSGAYRDLYKKAEELGVTKGNQSGIHSIAKEE